MLKFLLDSCTYVMALLRAFGVLSKNSSTCVPEELGVKPGLIARPYGTTLVKA